MLARYRNLAWSAGVLTAIAAGFGLGTIGLSQPANKPAANAPNSQPKSTKAATTAAAGSKAAHTNRLSQESSPYLLLHAHNPVDWRPWGPEAFEAARQQNRPIFLSVGYSSCFWCHVMERQVFENEDIARYMNEHYINIKVDREERPDIDDVYMTSLQVYLQAIGSSQGGGWPLSMFLTPDGKPFAGGTYYPPEDIPGRPGFPTVLKTVHDLWQSKQKDIETSAGIIAAEVKRIMQPSGAPSTAALNRALVDGSVASVLRSYDAEYGGLDFNPRRPDGPKFPVPSRLMLLQSQAGLDGGANALKAVDRTLEAMAAGGLYDHLAGGFHRYSTDRRWLVPHFEKMLYDNAQLAEVYALAYERTSRRPYRKIAEATLDFILREMTNPQGGFHSAFDAETDGVEGAFYVWKKDEVERILGPADAKVFSVVYGLDQPQTFEHGYVLRLPRPLAETAASLKLSEQDLERRLDGMRQKLLAVRNKRPALLEDDKVLTGWNGMMIRTLAEAGRVFQRKDYLAAAEKGVLFVTSRMRAPDGKLQRTWRGGAAKLNAYLEDYAYLISGMLALHGATQDDKWLHAARRLMDDQIALFWDDQSKGFYYTSHGHEELLARIKDGYDSALPSGNSVSARNLVRLSNLTTDGRYREYARDTIRAFATGLDDAPGSMPLMALALQEYLAAFGDEPAGTSIAVETPAQTPAAPPQGSPPPKPSSPPPEEKSAADEPLKPLVVQPADDSGQHKAHGTIYLGVEQLAPGGTIPVAIVFEIQNGWHLNANPPRPDYVIPVEVTLASKDGVELIDVRYPQGKDFKMAGIDVPLLVYEDRAVVYAMLKAPAGLAGKTSELAFNVRYQACNDMTCTRPLKIALTSPVKVASDAAAAKAINRALFEKAGK